MSTTTHAPTLTRSLPRPASAGIIAALQGTALTALWVGLGLVLHLDARVYVALGIPLTLAFQLIVRRRPVRDLWVCDGDPFRLDRRATGIAVLLTAYPLIALAVLLTQGQWLNALMALCCLPGAVAAGYAVRRFGDRPRRPAARAALLATVIGLGWMVYAIVPSLSGETSLLSMVGRGLHSLLLYLPVGFVLEEVSFRGAIDAHVHRPGESLGWLTAIFVSTLWALWHLPIDLGSQPLGDLVVTLLVIHVSIGVRCPSPGAGPAT
jgi:hypothetical protein